MPLMLAPSGVLCIAMAVSLWRAILLRRWGCVASGVGGTAMEACWIALDHPFAPASGREVAVFHTALVLAIVVFALAVVRGWRALGPGF